MSDVSENIYTQIVDKIKKLGTESTLPGQFILIVVHVMDVILNF